MSKYSLTLIGGISLLVASLGYTFTTNVALILLFRVISGLGYTLCSVCMATWIADLLPADRMVPAWASTAIERLGMARGPGIQCLLIPTLRLPKRLLGRLLL